MNESDFTPAELHALTHPPERTVEERVRIRAGVLQAIRETCPTRFVIRFLERHPDTLITPVFFHYQIALDVLSALGYRSKPGAHDDQEKDE